MNDMTARINSLSLGEKLVGGGGVLMLIGSFFPWWKYSEDLGGPFGDIDVSKTGWGPPGDVWSILAILVAIILAGVIVATRLGNMRPPALPTGFTWGQVWGGGAAVVVVLMLLKAWRILAADFGGFGFGFFIAVVATVLIAAGGYLLYSEERGGSVPM